jgi:hypothetical protein
VLLAGGVLEGLQARELVGGGDPALVGLVDPDHGVADDRDGEEDDDDRPGDQPPGAWRVHHVDRRTGAALAGGRA